MLGAVVDEAQPLDEDAGEHLCGASADAGFDTRVVVERVDDGVERVRERHVAEIVEPGLLRRLLEQLVASRECARHRGRIVATSRRLLHENV